MLHDAQRNAAAGNERKVPVGGSRSTQATVCGKAAVASSGTASAVPRPAGCSVVACTSGALRRRCAGGSVRGRCGSLSVSITRYGRRAKAIRRTCARSQHGVVVPEGTGAKMRGLNARVVVRLSVSPLGIGALTIQVVTAVNACPVPSVPSSGYPEGDPEPVQAVS